MVQDGDFDIVGRRGKRNALAAMTLAFGLAFGAGPAAAQSDYPSDMPATPMPDFKGCSASQESYLKTSWREAHYYTWLASKLVDYIRSQPAAEREALWDRDLLPGEAVSPSPRRWFGAYDGDRAKFVDEALDKAEARFRMAGSVVKGIKTVRCGQPIAKKDDEHIDVCPAGNPGGNGPPSAYHAPVGTIVTCPSFWNDANHTVGPLFEKRLTDSADTLVHELFHWLSVDAKYIVDYHADGAGGHPDGKYYGFDDVTDLARNKPSWAIRNNDSYAWFARSVAQFPPRLAGVWRAKEAGGVGGLLTDLSWEKLVSWWQQLGDGQYLADVEVYRRNGKWHYAAVWRIGAGNGALYFLPWDEFLNKWNELKDGQELIDIEIVRANGGWKYLGVWRQKQGRDRGSGGLFVGLSWDDFVAKWQELGSGQYLADIETFVDGGKRKFIGVWRVGSGNGALFWMKSWADFAAMKGSLNATQEMLDFEWFLDGGGTWNFLGVWRIAGTAGPLHASHSTQRFQPFTAAAFFDRWKELQPDRTLIDIEEYAPLLSTID